MNLEELAQRVAALEAEIGVIRQEAAAARALAAGADRDVADYRAELRGHTRTLNALRETQLEHGQAITQLSGRVDQLTGTVDQLTGTVDQLTGTVDQLTGTVSHIRDQHGAKLDDIVGLLNQLIAREDGQE
jgi:chromosome segregation ATPase